MHVIFLFGVIVTGYHDPHTTQQIICNISPTPNQNMSTFRIYEDVAKKPKRLKKVATNPSVVKSGVKFTNSVRRIENLTQGSKQRPTVYAGNSAELRTEKTDVRSLMENVFENFLLQIDELSCVIKTEPRSHPAKYEPSSKSYIEICERLRLEIMIAMDKLEILSIPRSRDEGNEQSCQLLHKMNHLKNLLTQLRWQYHNAIKNSGPI